MEARARAIFRGRVQGVFFRANCADHARSVGLRGFVRNLPDGTVEAVFEGPRDLIEEAIEWNRVRQPRARVTACDVSWSDPRGEFPDFSILR